MQLVKTRTDILDFLPKGGAKAELGVFLGDFSHEILTRTQPAVLDLYDNWEGFPRSGDKDGNNEHELEGNAAFTKVYERFQDFKEVRIYRKNTSFISNSPLFGSYSFIYIDADHSHEAVYNDLVNCYHAVYNGGYIGGHDYDLLHLEKTYRKVYDFGVKTAVNQFCEHFGQEIMMLTTDDCLQSFLIQVKKQSK